MCFDIKRLGEDNMKKILAVLLLLGLGAGTSSAGPSVLPEAIDPGEMVRLPPYCSVRVKGDRGSPEYREWRERIGENFEDYFHYCAGLNYINRYWSARTAIERNYYLERARANFDYIVGRLKPDFTMGSDLYSNRGEVFKLMGKPGDAIKDFKLAITIDPKVVGPYLQFADLYRGRNDRGRALEVITEGLRNIPDSKSLQRRYLELGGKEPFPEPVAAKVAEPLPPKPVELTPTPGETTDPTYVPAVTAGSAPEVITEPSSPTGTPNNPYCRFCPPE
jgi:hypothetical protein